MADKRNRDRKGAPDPSTGQNRINEGTNIVGDIVSKGFFRIDGEIKGNVTTPSKVVLGAKGKITGTLVCDQADIEGTIEGNIDVKGLLTLRSTANIQGDVIVGKLAVDQGAIFDATCKMHTGVGNSQSLSKEKK